MATVQIPDSHQDLLTCPPISALTTVMPDGQPQTTAVWFDFDGTYFRVNTMRGFQKEKNMRRNPKVTLFAYNPANTLHTLEVRGQVVEMTEDEALTHLDGLSELYIGKSPYFGECVPAEFKEREIPVLCKIKPLRVVTIG